MRAVAIVMPSAGRYDAQGVMAEARKMAGVDTVPIISPDLEGAGFTATVNRGLAQVSDEHDVMIINDDIDGFYLGWLAQLQNALYSRENIGLIGPSGDCSTTPMNLAPKGGEGMQSVRWFPFWCVLIRAEAFRQVGHLDARFIHYSSDYDYCDRLREAGWAVVWLKEAVLQHIAGGSGKRKAWAGHDLSLYMLRMDRKKARGTWVDIVSLS